MLLRLNQILLYGGFLTEFEEKEIEEYISPSKINSSFLSLIKNLESISGNKIPLAEHWDSLRFQYPAYILEDMNVVGLNLAECGLKEFPMSIFKFKRLIVLDLSNNEIKSIPKSIEKLKFLEELLLRKNRISKLPESILNLKFLEKLDLKENPIYVKPNLKMKTMLNQLESRGIKFYSY